jgi:hypothetical protein
VLSAGPTCAEGGYETFFFELIERHNYSVPSTQEPVFRSQQGIDFENHKKIEICR